MGKSENGHTKVKRKNFVYRKKTNGMEIGPTLYDEMDCPVLMFLHFPGTKAF